jgi:hypothetical protein
MSISIKLLESDSVIKNKINNAIAQELNVYIKNKIPQLTSRIKDLTISVMASSPENKRTTVWQTKSRFWFNFRSNILYNQLYCTNTKNNNK